MKTRMTSKVALLAGLLIVNAAPAMAAGPVSSPDGGARASSSVATGYISDTKCDDRAAQGQWSISGGTQKLDNRSGCNTQANKTYSARIDKVRACTVKTLAPDDCSSWV